MLSQQLIESALQLTGKTYEQFMEYHMSGPEFGWYRFCYYLLSPSFQDKYYQLFGSCNDCMNPENEFGGAIYEYQSGQEQPLIELLSKIK